ncbi:hypothetical protein BDW59DRAFT_176493 [Aspergillus cavernicola]|uniref:DUF1996 domain-containing protein n=1 Tax=Aspergillus cavernicola TaxID=176166 RepID=A0ABR4HFT9_9EURO
MALKFLFLAIAFPLVQSQGEFTTHCAPLTIERSDPIVNPGTAGGHTHTVIGGTGFSRQMSPSAAPNSINTTCSIEMDHSNYWQPLLYHIRSDGQFEMIPFEGSVAYYLQRTRDYSPNKTSCDPSVYPQAPPEGLRMVTGNPFLRAYNDTPDMRAQSHMCLKESDPSSYTQALPTEPCLKLRAQTFFPSCWDGENLDSDDHKSHMAFPAIGDYNTGVCPESHPVAILSIFLKFFYDTSGFPDWQNWIYAMGDLTGYGLHGDFVNGWKDLDALANAFETCSGGDLSLHSPGCSITGGTIRDVDVRLDGPLAKLPGKNEISGDVADRVN